jgi:hypothetical protein
LEQYLAVKANLRGVPPGIPPRLDREQVETLEPRFRGGLPPARYRARRGREILRLIDHQQRTVADADGPAITQRRK